ncbi:MAG: aminotransferase class I/II-fold pyridoxal phosphate-dependent enzyme [Legionellaceae bacterium]|nr:aminotransferase class I/II-fold pyridoxal phosphate-dependent enzyme [Legionellaceae bacterium]
MTYIIPTIHFPFPIISAQPRNLVNLMTGELLHPEINFVLKEMKQTNTDGIQFYPILNEYKERIGKKLNTAPDTMLFSAGTALMISILMDAFGTTAKKLIIQIPSYPTWINYAALRKIEIEKIIFGQTIPQAFCFDNLITALERSESAMVVITNPHSPTGFCFSKQEMKEISRVCSNNSHLLIVDECYAAFSEYSHDELINSNERVILLRSFSKSHGIAGIRIGLTITSQEICNYLSHWQPEFTVSEHAISVLEHMLMHQERINQVWEDIVTNREKFIFELKKIRPDWQALPSATNFVVFKLEHQDTPLLLTNFFAEHGIRIHNLSFLPGLNQCIRITITHWDIMQNVLKLCKEFNDNRTH